MYTCFDKESHISRRTCNLLYFPHEINTEAASVEEVRFQQKSRHPSTKAGKAQLRWEDHSGRVERAAMRCMLRQGEDSCWHGSDRRNSRGEGDWNKFPDRLLKRLWRQDYIEPSYGSYTGYPTFMFKKISSLCIKSQCGIIKQPSATWNASALLSPALFRQRRRQMGALNDCEQGWVNKKWLQKYGIWKVGTLSGQGRAMEHVADWIV